MNRIKYERNIEHCSRLIKIAHIDIADNFNGMNRIATTQFDFEDARGCLVRKMHSTQR